MKYFVVSQDGNSFALEQFSAANDKQALLYMIDAWSGFDKGEDYQHCKSKGISEIKKCLADINMLDEVVDLALFRADGVGTFGKDDNVVPVWSLSDYANTYVKVR